MHLLNARQLHKYSAEDELLWRVQKYVSDFRSKLTPGEFKWKSAVKPLGIENMICLEIAFSWN